MKRWEREKDCGREEEAAVHTWLACSSGRFSTYGGGAWMGRPAHSVSRPIPCARFVGATADAPPHSTER